MYSSTLSLTSALDGEDGQRNTPVALRPRMTWYYYIGGWVGPKAGVDEYSTSRPRRDSIPEPLNSQ